MAWEAAHLFRTPHMHHLSSVQPAHEIFIMAFDDRHVRALELDPLERQWCEVAVVLTAFRVYEGNRILRRGKREINRAQVEGEGSD